MVCADDNKGRFHQVAWSNKCGAALETSTELVVAYPEKKARVFKQESVHRSRSIRSIPLTTRKGFPWLRNQVSRFV